MLWARLKVLHRILPRASARREADLPQQDSPERLNSREMTELPGVPHSLTEPVGGLDDGKHRL